MFDYTQLEKMDYPLRMGSGERCKLSQIDERKCPFSVIEFTSVVGGMILDSIRLLHGTHRTLSPYLSIYFKEDRA